MITTRSKSLKIKKAGIQNTRLYNVIIISYKKLCCLFGILVDHSTMIVATIWLMMMRCDHGSEILGVATYQKDKDLELQFWHLHSSKAVITMLDNIV